MINFYLEAIEPAAGEHWAMLVVQPQDSSVYDQLAARLRRAGCKFLSTREYVGVMWPETSCTVTVQPLDGVPHVTELHTGATRITPTGRLDAPPLFAEAIKRGRLLLALINAGMLPVFGGDKGVMPAEVREHLGEQLDAAVASRQVLAGYARVLDRPAPSAGNLNRRVR